MRMLLLPASREEDAKKGRPRSSCSRSTSSPWLSQGSRPSICTGVVWVVLHDQRRHDRESSTVSWGSRRFADRRARRSRCLRPDHRGSAVWCGVDVTVGQLNAYGPGTSFGASTPSGSAPDLPDRWTSKRSAKPPTIGATPSIPSSVSGRLRRRSSGFPASHAGGIAASRVDQRGPADGRTRRCRGRHAGGYRFADRRGNTDDEQEDRRWRALAPRVRRCSRPPPAVDELRRCRLRIGEPGTPGLHRGARCVTHPVLPVSAPQPTAR